MHPIPFVPRTHDSRPRRGVSLVEILIALSVAAFAFFPILRLFNHSMRDSMKISDYAHARELAAKTMDELLARPYEALAPGAAQSFPDGYLLPRSERRGQTLFTIEAEVAELRPSWKVRHINLAGAVSDPVEFTAKETELKRITTRVSWQGIGAAQSYALTSLKADLYE